MDLAPIVLFVYNRPEHTLETLKSLSENTLSVKSSLIIFCDGPKKGATEESLGQIKKVKEICRQKKWCGQVEVLESELNKGLAKSIKEGVTQVVNEYGKVIVLEDDIVTSPYFLEYMNQALSLYEKDEKVMHISSYWPNTTKYLSLDSTFFLSFMSCWGWATWKNRWDKAIWDFQFHLDQLKDPKIKRRFNLDNSLLQSEQLENNINGTINTWAINWYATIFHENALCLYPSVSLSSNIGLDGSGTNCDALEVNLNVSQKSVPVRRIKIKESKIARNYLIRYYRFGENSDPFKIFKFHYIKLRFRLIKIIKGI